MRPPAALSAAPRRPPLHSVTGRFGRGSFFRLHVGFFLGLFAHFLTAPLPQGATETRKFLKFHHRTQRLGRAPWRGRRCSCHRCGIMGISGIIGIRRDTGVTGPSPTAPRSFGTDASRNGRVCLSHPAPRAAPGRALSIAPQPDLRLGCKPARGITKESNSPGLI